MKKRSIPFLLFFAAALGVAVLYSAHSEQPQAEDMTSVIEQPRFAPPAPSLVMERAQESKQIPPPVPQKRTTVLLPPEAEPEEEDFSNDPFHRLLAEGPDSVGPCLMEGDFDVDEFHMLNELDGVWLEYRGFVQGGSPQLEVWAEAGNEELELNVRQENFLMCVQEMIAVTAMEAGVTNIEGRYRMGLLVEPPPPPNGATKEM